MIDKLFLINKINIYVYLNIVININVFFFSFKKLYGNPPGTGSASCSETTNQNAGRHFDYSFLLPGSSQRSVIFWFWQWQQSSFNTFGPCWSGLDNNLFLIYIFSCLLIKTARLLSCWPNLKNRHLNGPAASTLSSLASKLHCLTVKLPFVFLVGKLASRSVFALSGTTEQNVSV